jgi:hypothetical protein
MSRTEADEPNLATLERHHMALYEARLTQIGERGTEEEEDIKARQWAACALGDACHHLRWGLDL